MAGSAFACSTPDSEPQSPDVGGTGGQLGSTTAGTGGAFSAVAGSLGAAGLGTAGNGGALVSSGSGGHAGFGGIASVGAGGASAGTYSGGVGGGGAGSVGSSGASGASGAGNNAACEMIKSEYLGELDKQLACTPNAASQCSDRAAAEPGCECRVFIEPADPFAIEHLSNVANGWFTADCSLPTCPAQCSTAATGTCQADAKSSLRGRRISP